MSDLETVFADAVGRRPEGVWSAPGRVNLIGEHTDHNEGHVLPFAIDRRCRVALARRDDDVVTVRSAQTDGVVDTVVDRLAHASGWAAYPLGTLWALGERGLPRSGWDLVVDGGVPLGAGLSSSAALEAAVALGAAEVAGPAALAVDRLALAAAGRRAENEVVGAPVGIMDQAASLLCSAGSALLLDCRTLEHVDVPLHLDGHTLLVADTGVRHDLADGGYADRARGCREAADRLGVAALRDATPEMLDRLAGAPLRRARHVVTEQARVQRVVELLHRGLVAEVGPELTASHASLRDDYEVSLPVLDAVVDAALGAGALGARLVGGGFGGSVLALVGDDAADAVTDAVGRAGAATVREVAPAEGARRDS